MKTKKFVAMSLSVILVFILCACGAQSTTPAAANTKSTASTVPATGSTTGSTVAAPGAATAANAKHVIRLAHVNATTTWNHEIVMEWKRMVEEKSKGEIFVDVYPSGQLMGVDQELPSVLEGRIEAAYIHGMIGENVTELYQIWGFPVIFGTGKDSMQNIYDFVTTDLYQTTVLPKFEEKGYKAWIGFADVDHGVFTVSKELNDPDDMAGLRIRSHGGASASEFIKLMGASPITIASTELSTALMQGTVDGVETGKIYADKSAFPNLKYFYECASDYAGCGNAVVLSKKFYDGLSPELQKVLDEAGQEMTKWTLDEVTKRNDESIQNLEKTGMTITYADEADAIKIFEKFKPQLEKLCAANPELGTMVDYILENNCPYPLKR